MTKKTILLLFFILLKFTLQYLILNPEYDLQRDEYLHLDQAKHLAWGYTSVPPLTSWISFIILKLGNGVFWVKFFPALFGVLTLILVWKTIELLKGNLFALILGASAIIFSALLRINMLYQPNSMDFFFWTLLYYTLLKYFASNDNKYLLLSGAVFGFGFLAKYNIVFMLLGLLPAILISEHRKIFLKKEFYYALLVALVIMLPNLLWQYKNHFAVFNHLNELSQRQLIHVNIGVFLEEQVLFFLGSFFTLIAACVAFFTYAPFKKYRFIFFGFVFTLALYIYFKAKPYYAIGLYPVLLAFGAVYLEKILNSGWKLYLRPLVVALPLLAFLPLYEIVFPIYSPEKIAQISPRYKKFNQVRWEDGKDHALPQDFADMLGWSELAHKVDSVYNLIPDKENTIIHCDNYGQAGAINFYTKQKNFEALSENADYINWYQLDKNPIKNIILIRSSDRTINDFEKSLFQTWEYCGKIENIYAREYGTQIYLLKGARVNINELLKKEIEEKKNN